MSHAAPQASLGISSQKQLKDTGVANLFLDLGGVTTSGGFLHPTYPKGHPCCQLTKQMGHMQSQAGEHALPSLLHVVLSLASPAHLHLHVAMHVGRQGGPVKDEVVHHHVQCQPRPPVRHGLVQGTRRPLLSFELRLKKE